MNKEVTLFLDLLYFHGGERKLKIQTVLWWL